MKSFIYVATFFISISAFSQQTQFIEYYGSYCSDIGMSVLQTKDGGYLVCGLTENYTASNINIYLMKVDSLGQFEWHELYGGSWQDFGQYMEQTHDNGYIICGFTNSFGQGLYDAYIVKIDSVGGFEWQNTFGGSDYEYAYCVKQTSENGYLICGSTQSFGNGARDGFLTKTDSTGNEIWTKYYGGSNNDGLYRLINDGDSVYYLCGYTYSSGAGADDAFLVKTDTAGNIIWQKTFGSPNSERGMCFAKRDNIIWIGAYSNNFGNGAQTWFLKCNTAGSLLRDTTLGGVNNDIPFELDIADNGDILLCGETNSYGAGGTDVYLLRVDTNYNKIWETYFGETLDESGFSIKATQDGGCIISGSTYSFNIDYSDVYLIKTNALGEATDISNFTLKQEHISIYPNPTTDAIIIESKNSSKIDKVSIYNLNGKNLSTTFPNNKHAKTPIKQFANGTYIIEVSIYGKLISKKFIKQ